MRCNLDAGNRELEEAAYEAGVLPRSFGQFHRAGYEGLYGGLGPEEIKKLKGVEPKEDLLDRMGIVELAANNFRATQTAEKLRREGVVGQTRATQTHRHLGEVVRDAIDSLGGTMPEELPAEPSIKPLLKRRARNSRKGSLPSTSPSQ